MYLENSKDDKLLLIDQMHCHGAAFAREFS